MTVVNGKDVLLYVRRGTTWVKTVCATDCSLSFTAEKISITTSNSGRDNDYIGGMKDCAVSLDGVTTLDQLTSWQFEDWVDQIGERVRILLTFNDTFGDQLAYDMILLVESADVSGAVSDFAGYSIHGSRCGAHTKIKTYDHVLVDSFGNPILDSNGDLIRVP
jgi:predicted secreted protein